MDALVLPPIHTFYGLFDIYTALHATFDFCRPSKDKLVKNDSVLSVVDHPFADGTGGSHLLDPEGRDNEKTRIGHSLVPCALRILVPVHDTDDDAYRN